MQPQRVIATQRERFSGALHNAIRVFEEGRLQVRRHAQVERRIVRVRFQQRPTHEFLAPEPNQLIVAGSKAPESTEGREFLHMGIANRNFERRFQLADYIRVLNADLADGILVITLRREIPEALKPRKVTIGATVESNVTQLESKKDDSKAA